MPKATTSHAALKPKRTSKVAKKSAKSSAAPRSVRRRRSASLSIRTTPDATNAVPAGRYIARAARADDIPRFDLRELFDPNSHIEASIELFEMLKDVGAIWLTGHRITTRRLEELYDWTKQLFKVPGLESLRPADVNNPWFRGYDPPMMRSPSDSEFNNESRTFYSFGYQHDTEQANIWPSVAQWRDTRECQEFMNKIYDEMHHDIGSPLLKALGVAANRMLDGDGTWNDETLRTWHGKICDQVGLLQFEVQDKAKHQMMEHTDDSTFTLLVSDRPGLELQDRESRARAPLPMFEEDKFQHFARARENDRYIRLPAFKGNDILVLAGDFIETWTHGAIKAARHRVCTTLEDGEAPYVRNTMANFITPNRGLYMSHHLGWGYKGKARFRYGGHTVDEHMRHRYTMPGLIVEVEDKEEEATTRESMAGHAGVQAKPRRSKRERRPSVKLRIASKDLA